MNQNREWFPIDCSFCYAWINEPHYHLHGNVRSCERCMSHRKHSYKETQKCGKKCGFYMDKETDIFWKPD